MGLTSIQLYMPSASPPVSQLLLAHSVPCAWCLRCYIPVFDPHNVLAFLRFFSRPPLFWELSPTEFLRRGACENDCGRPWLFLMDECLPQGTFSSTVDCTAGGEFPAWDGIISMGLCREACALNGAVWIQRGQRFKYAFLKMPNRIADLSNHFLLIMFPKECAGVGRISLFLVHINLR